MLIAIATVSLFAASPVTTNQAYQLNRVSKLFADAQVGTNLRNAQQFGVKAKWDYSVQGGASGDISLLDMENKAVKLPTGAIIKDCMIDVVTQPTSSTGSGSIAFSSKAVADLKAATFVAGYTTSARIACIPDRTVGNTIKLASEATLKIRVGSEALTAGKINVWVQYVLSE